MKARDLMIPDSDCAKVAEDRTIYDAVIMLEAWRERFAGLDYRPRTVFVYDKDFRIIGSLRHVDMLRSLESASSEGLSTGQSYNLTELYRASHHVRVKDAMYFYREAEYIDENTPIEEALSRLLAGPYLNLVLTSGNTTIGILRLCDLFSMACKGIKKSGMK